MLTCTGLGDTLVECFSSDGPGASESAWLPTAAPLHAVEGYTSESSVAPGEALELHVSTSPAEDYRVEIYRLGWYDGDGGRLVGCLIRLRWKCVRSGRSTSPFLCRMIGLPVTIWRI